MIARTLFLAKAVENHDFDVQMGDGSREIPKDMSQREWAETQNLYRPAIKQAAEATLANLKVTKTNYEFLSK